MNNQNKMFSAASAALEYLFKISETDNVLILTDAYSTAIAEAFEKTSIRERMPG